MIPLFL